MNTAIVAILGTGAWGSALGKIARSNQHDVHFWSHRGEIPIGDVVANAAIIVSAVSMKGVIPTTAKLKQLDLPTDRIIVTATKGLDPDTRTPSQIWQSTFPDHPVVVLSGPNLSKEIAKGLPAATVLASKDLKAARKVQSILSSDTFRAYVNEDPTGTELGGTLKNVMAIAPLGFVDGMELGTNAKAALLTRALPEMIRIGTHLWRVG